MLLIRLKRTCEVAHFHSRSFANGIIYQSLSASNASFNESLMMNIQRCREEDCGSPQGTTLFKARSQATQKIEIRVKNSDKNSVHDNSGNKEANYSADDRNSQHPSRVSNKTRAMCLESHSTASVSQQYQSSRTMML